MPVPVRYTPCIASVPDEYGHLSVLAGLRHCVRLPTFQCAATASGICFLLYLCSFFFFFSSRRRHTRSDRDWSSDVCSSDLAPMTVVDDVPPGFGASPFDTASPFDIPAPPAFDAGPPPRTPFDDAPPPPFEIGRASCRERV